MGENIGREDLKVVENVSKRIYILDRANTRGIIMGRGIGGLAVVGRA